MQTNIVAATADDRSITLYDIRASSPMRKIKLDMRSNRLCWNPQEAFNFTVANEVQTQGDGLCTCVCVCVCLCV